MGSLEFQTFQLESLRARLRKMSDDELIRFGRAAVGMCSPEANFIHAPRKVFVEQLAAQAFKSATVSDFGATQSRTFPHLHLNSTGTRTANTLEKRQVCRSKGTSVAAYIP